MLNPDATDPAMRVAPEELEITDDINLEEPLRLFHDGGSPVHHVIHDNHVDLPTAEDTQVSLELVGEVDSL